MATEVRSLAQRSADVAREIKVLIGSSVENVDADARPVQAAGSTMGEIVASVPRVTDVIGQITAAGAEQSLGIAQVNDAVPQMDQMTQQNASLVEERAAATESMEDQAQRLTQSVQVFLLSGNATAAPVTALAASRRAQAALAAPQQCQAAPGGATHHSTRPG